MAVTGPVIENLIEALPDPIAQQVEAHTDAGETTYLALATDITRNGEFGESWLVATDKRLLIVRPESETDDARPEGSSPLVDLPLEQVNVVETHDFHGMGVLEIATDDGVTEEVSFSRSIADKFSDAVGVVEELVKQVRPDGKPPSTDEQSGSAEEKPRPKRVTKPRCPQCGRALPRGTDICPACLKKGELLFRIMGYARPYWGLSLFSFFLSMAVTVLNLAPIDLMRRLTDFSLRPIHPMTMPARLGVLRECLIALVIIRLVMAIVTAVRRQVMGWLGQKIMFDVRTQVYDHLHKLSLSFYDKKSLGGLMSRVTNDTSVINSFIVDGLQNMLINVMTLVVIGIILFRYNFWLALLVMAPAPLLAGGTVWFSRRIRNVYRRYWREVSSMNTILASSISGVRVVKGFAQEGREKRRFRAKNYDLLRVNMSSVRLQTVYYPAMGLIGQLGGIIIWMVGGPQVLRHQLTLGTFMAFVGYMWQFYAPIGVLTDIHNTIQQVATAGERVFEVLDTEPDVKEERDAKAMPRIVGRVEFKDVCFRYDTQEPGDYVLDHINFTAEPGELVGLVGHSGSGKTTLVNLLLRFYDATEGQIIIDGQDITEVKLRSLREQIGIVLQEPFLFSGTIAENIAYGRPDATRDEIIAAAKSANAHRFIVRFPDAYDTEVGERGVRLSGGEKQRISIARAIVNNPRILILDEATSAVDTETEQLIQEALDTVMRDRTVFAIAHRLSTLRNASKLIVLDRGKIAETGSHEELLAKEDGVYRRLCKIQTDMAQTVALPEE